MTVENKVFINIAWFLSVDFILLMANLLKKPYKQHRSGKMAKFRQFLKKALQFREK
jgi:hypothetical protein